MKPYLRIMLAVLAIASSAKAVYAAADQLVNSVYTLELAQDKIAQGDQDALIFSQKLMRQIAADILATPTEKLSDTAVRDAILVYVLSGGNPAPAVKRLDQATQPLTPLLTGILAYAQANRTVAQQALADHDDEDMSLSLRGRLALVMAILTSDKAEKALQFLRRARSLMPGTLVEEAALRRCLPLAARQHQVAEFLTCSSRYIRNFPHSLYWPDFSSTLSSHLIRLDKDDQKLTALLKNITETLPTDRKLTLYLQLGYDALTRGRLPLAQAIAEQASAMAMASTTEMRRAQLYMAIATLFGENFKHASQELQTFDVAAFAAADQKLLQQARQIQQLVTAAPEAIDQQALPAEILAQESSQTLDDYSNLVNRATQLLAQEGP